MNKLLELVQLPSTDLLLLQLILLFHVALLLDFTINFDLKYEDFQ